MKAGPPPPDARRTGQTAPTSAEAAPSPDAGRVAPSTSSSAERLGPSDPDTSRRTAETVPAASPLGADDASTASAGRTADAYAPNAPPWRRPAARSDALPPVGRPPRRSTTQRADRETHARPERAASPPTSSERSRALPHRPAVPPTAASEPEARAKAWVGRLFDTAWASQIYHWLTDHEMWAEQNAGLLAHLGPNAPADPTILDLGAGTGIGTRALAQALDGRGEVIGLEYAQPMVDRAARAQARDPLPNVRFQQGDATRLDLADASVDYVVANSFLYLVPDAAGALAEARRVLRPGGRLIFMEPREEGRIVDAAAHALGHAGELLRRPSSATRLTAAMVAWRVMSGLEGRMPEPELRRLLTEAGFADVRFEPTLGGLGHHVIAER